MLTKRDRVAMAEKGLTLRGIPYTKLNNGWCLRITLCDPPLDYWPTTGRYRYVGGDKNARYTSFAHLLTLLKREYNRRNQHGNDTRKESETESGQGA